ncbi:transcription factor MYB16 isoform X2 [Iris pallida]|uniref:Transcription factor MYB16 isoform X2 n=1 Tax=Iris pallida TaxID=29817 RepID=A0AAX6G743_IRIPA|nr:transcription factor MYB16 isoform X2 [Iris pallida]
MSHDNPSAPHASHTPHLHLHPSFLLTFPHSSSQLTSLPIYISLPLSLLISLSLSISLLHSLHSLLLCPRTRARRRHRRRLPLPPRFRPASLPSGRRHHHGHLHHYNHLHHHHHDHHHIH